MIKAILPNKHILFISIILIFISFISVFYNFKSLKQVLASPSPIENTTFDENTLINTVKKFMYSQTKDAPLMPDLKVLAIAYSKDPHQSMILINSSCGKRVLMIGESVCGYNIENIKPNYIITKINGKIVDIKLSHNKETTGKNTNINLPSLRQLLNASNTYIIKRNKLLEITSNPSKMFSEIDLEPTPKGFMFKEVKPDSLFYNMGIRAGDILLSINNRHLNSPEDAFRILETIRNDDNFSVKILRDNEPIRLNYKVR